MFRGLLFVFATNHALWKLGIEPTVVPKEIRRSAHLTGYGRGYSPQEMAAGIGYFLTGGGALGNRALLAIMAWSDNGKVRLDVLKEFQQAAKLTAQPTGTHWVERLIDAPRDA
jgi:hypothetical protein